MMSPRSPVEQPPSATARMAESTRRIGRRHINDPSSATRPTGRVDSPRSRADDLLFHLQSEREGRVRCSALIGLVVILLLVYRASSVSKLHPCNLAHRKNLNVRTASKSHLKTSRI